MFYSRLTTCRYGAHVVLRLARSGRAVFVRGALDAWSFLGPWSGVSSFRAQGHSRNSSSRGPWLSVVDAMTQSGVSGSRFVSISPGLPIILSCIFSHR